MTLPNNLSAPDAAAWYLARGFRVVPLFGVDGQGCTCRNALCLPRDHGKHCLSFVEDRWKNGRPFTPADFRDGDNVALAMGDQGWRDWLVALDCDVYSLDPRTSLLDLPPTLEHTTPRGWHAIYTVPPFTPLGNWLDVFSTRDSGTYGMDLRYARGRIVVPPSRGTTGEYRWDEWREPVPLPRSFIDRVLDVRRRRGLPVTDTWDRRGKRP